MATRTFALNTTPHVATIGETELKFQPEADGAVFAGAYSALKRAQKDIAAAGDDIGADELLAVAEAMRAFLMTFLMPESAKVFTRLKLPDRILVGLIEWTAEIYGGGSGNHPAPGGPSSAS